MKRLACVLGGVAVVAFAANASAGTIAYTTVVQADTYVTAANLADSGAATEEAWVETFLGTNVTYEQLSNSGASKWLQVTGDPTGTDLYAYDFGVANGGDYFVVKTGNIAGTSFEHFLYNNLISLQYAVIDLNNFGLNLVIEVGKVSHVGEVNPGGGTPTQFSVPDGGATVLMLGAALSGLGIARRFMRR